MNLLGPPDVLGLSKRKLTVSPASSALMVIMSSRPAQRSILLMLFRFMPMEKARSDRKCSKPSDRSDSATRETWLESMACSEMPAVDTSKFASVTSSRIASRIYTDMIEMKVKHLLCTSKVSQHFVDGLNQADRNPPLSE